MKKISLFSFLVLLLMGCVEVLNSHKTNNSGSATDVNFPASFEFASSKQFTLDITTLDNGNHPLTNVVISYGFKLDTANVIVGSVATDANGFARVSNTLPDYLDSLVILPQYIGLIKETSIKINKGSNQLTLGGKSTPGARISISNQINSRTMSGFSYLSTYDSQGVPTNLEPVNDYIPQDFLDQINYSLPETKSVPVYHPEFIGNFNNDTRLLDSADVWVTFVYEGAGYRNALGYYTYNLNSPPTSPDQISSYNIIFPNVSLVGSGGGLHSGNKVHLGSFAPNTGIGWFVVSDGWNGSAVAQKPQIKYSNKDFNTYNAPQYRQQMVLLRSDARQLTLLSFEDISRPGGDSDFNDVIFYVTSNPYTAMATGSLAKLEQPKGTDTDGDGVLDGSDQYPNDPARAYNQFNPAKNVFGSLAYEDMWPNKGDYDMNDLVADYNFLFITNAANSVTDVKMTFIVRAIGANYHSGFGIELSVDPTTVKSIEGLNQQYLSTISLNSNGTEAGQSNTVVILFENGHALFNTENMVNTQQGHSYLQPITLTATIHFVSPVPMIDLGYAPFNPFIFVNGNRGAEVHLADQLPSDKADKTMLGTYVDSSNPATGRYYRSGSNMPWAINLPLLFDYPSESKPITDTHIKFKDWGQSSGSSYKDWFQNKSGYRNTQDVYVKP